MLGFAGRIFTYLCAMFPLHVNVPAGVLLFYSFYLLAQRTGGKTVGAGVESLPGLATVLLCMLLLRVIDDLKDQASDPGLFPDRPLVKGTVRYSDVRGLALVCILALVALNVGRGVTTQAFFIYFVYIVLTWQWFFFPDHLPKRMGLVLLSHQPLVPLAFAYVYAVYVETSGAEWRWGSVLPLCLAYWLPMFAWEMARKVRAPEEETEYVTYSRVLGSRGAALVPLFALLGAGGLFAWVGSSSGLSRGFLTFLAVLVVAAALLVLAFAVRPVRATNRVRAAVEGFTLLLHAGLIVDLLLPRFLGGS